MLNKIKDLSQILLSCFVIRLLVTGATVGDALVIIALSTLYGVYHYLEVKKVPEVNKDILDRLALVEERASKNENKLGVMQIRRS